MKKLILFLLMVPICAFAADQDEICRRNTLTMLVIQKDEPGTFNPESDLNNTDKKWIVHFNYDLFANMRPGITASDIYGSATCNGKDVKSNLEGTSNNAGLASVGDANTFLKSSPLDSGVNCWCKMDGPVTSWWTYFKKYDTKQLCKEQCATYCAEKFATNDFIDQANDIRGRYALFNTIW
ncbi:MAG: hypothetical protein R8N24_01500 [Alphaproteobacteria bacterium]|nr:hypothetical protein [Alphaproteobacteria bacterium]